MTTPSTNPLAVDALISQLELEKLQDIQAGIAEADAGQFASDEEVAAVFSKYGA